MRATSAPITYLACCSCWPRAAAPTMSTPRPRPSANASTRHGLESSPSSARRKRHDACASHPRRQPAHHACAPGLSRATRSASLRFTQNEETHDEREAVADFCGTCRAGPVGGVAHRGALGQRVANGAPLVFVSFSALIEVSRRNTRSARTRLSTR